MIALKLSGKRCLTQAGQVAQEEEDGGQPTSLSLTAGNFGATCRVELSMDMPHFPIGTMWALLRKLFNKPIQQLQSKLLLPLVQTLERSDRDHLKHLKTDIWKDIDENIECSFSIPTDIHKKIYKIDGFLNVKSKVKINKMIIQLKAISNVKGYSAKFSEPILVRNMESDDVFSYDLKGLTGKIAIGADGKVYSNHKTYQIIVMDIIGDDERYNGEYCKSSQVLYPTYNQALDFHLKNGNWTEFNGRIYNTHSIKIAKINFLHRLKLYTYPLIMGSTYSIENGFKDFYKVIFEYLINRETPRNLLFWILLYTNKSTITPNSEFVTVYDKVLEHTRTSVKGLQN